MTLAEVFELISKYGPGVIFAVMWWFERDERKDLQKEVKEIARDSVVAMTEMKAMIGQLAMLFKSAGGTG